MPVGVLQIRPGGEIIQFHLFHQERPWHGATPTHTRALTHCHKHNDTHSQTQQGADGLASVLIRLLTHQQDGGEPGEDCRQVVEEARADSCSSKIVHRRFLSSFFLFPSLFNVSCSSPRAKKKGEKCNFSTGQLPPGGAWRAEPCQQPKNK